MAKKQQPAVDGKAHAAMFDPLQTIKNEADTTNTAADVKPDPFADIGKYFKSSSYLDNETGCVRRNSCLYLPWVKAHAQ